MGHQVTPLDTTPTIEVFSALGTESGLQVFNLLNSTAVNQWVDYVLNEGDEFIPSNWVKPRRLMLRIGLEY